MSMLAIKSVTLGSSCPWSSLMNFVKAGIHNTKRFSRSALIFSWNRSSAHIAAFVIRWWGSREKRTYLFQLTTKITWACFTSYLILYIYKGCLTITRVARNWSLFEVQQQQMLDDAVCAHDLNVYMRSGVDAYEMRCLTLSTNALKCGKHISHTRLCPGLNFWTISLLLKQHKFGSISYLFFDQLVGTSHHEVYKVIAGVRESSATSQTQDDVAGCLKVAIDCVLNTLIAARESFSDNRKIL